MEKEMINWGIHISTSADTKGISKEVLTKALKSMEHPVSVKFKKEFRDKLDKEHSGTVVIWQNDKERELEKLFLDNLSIEFEDNKVKMSSTYEVDFPNDWDYRDVVEWINSTQGIIQAYLMINMEEIVKSHKEKITYDDTENRTIISVFDELKKNQSFSFADDSKTYKFNPGDYEWDIENMEWT